MYYEINVAQKEAKLGWNGQPEYRHLFATHERSITTEWELKRALKIFAEKFPAPEFNVTATCWQNRGTGIDIDEVIKG